MHLYSINCFIPKSKSIGGDALQCITSQLAPVSTSCFFQLTGEPRFSQCSSSFNCCKTVLFHFDVSLFFSSCGYSGNSLEGLVNLETLDLSANRLTSFKAGVLLLIWYECLFICFVCLCTYNSRLVSESTICS